MWKDKIKALIPVGEEGNNKKKIENLVVFLIILVITILAINFIWSGGKKEQKQQTSDANKKLASTANTTIETNSTVQDTLMNNLEEILTKIEGVGNVKVLITYSQTSETIPMYNEDTSQKDTQETDKTGGTRKVTETDTKKDIIYEESNGTKTPITQSVVSPKIEGALITAQGVNDANIKANIIQAVQAATGLPTHKIQVFEMKK